MIINEDREAASQRLLYTTYVSAAQLLDAGLWPLKSLIVAYHSRFIMMETSWELHCMEAPPKQPKEGQKAQSWTRTNSARSLLRVDGSLIINSDSGRVSVKARMSLQKGVYLLLKINLFQYSRH